MLMKVMQKAVIAENGLITTILLATDVVDIVDISHDAKALGGKGRYDKPRQQEFK